MRKLTITAALSFTAVFALLPAAAQSVSEQERRKQQDALLEIVNTNVVGIVGGSLSSTRSQMVLDMRDVLSAKDKFRIVTIVGQAATQNVIDLFFLRGVDVAVVQSDVLSSLNSRNSIPRIKTQIRYVAPLHQEALHVIVGGDVTSVQDLAGRTVNFSRDSSGTFYTASSVLAQLGVRVKSISVGDSEGLEMVKGGKIAATIRLDGQLPKDFASVELADELRLLDVPIPSNSTGDYRPIELNAADYPGLIARGRSVRTVAVGLVMVTRNWPRNGIQHRKIAKFMRGLADKFPQFQEANRVSRWGQVKLDARVRGWQRFNPDDDGRAAAQFARTPTRRSTNADVGDERAPATPTVEEIFREFQRWSNEDR